MKYIIILGKGPSSKPLKESSKYDIATINNSIWLASNPTYSFFNDLESFEQMTDEDFKGVTDLIVPSYLHTQSNPRFNNKSTDFHFYRLSEFFPERFNHINIYPYELHPNDNSRPEELERIRKHPTQIPPKLPEWPGSTGQTATMWLSMFKNYSNIIMMGCDPKGGYNPVFEKNSPHYMGSVDTPSFGGNSTAAQPRGYDLDFAQSLKWAKHYGVNLRHIDEVPKEEQKELGLL
tara:strand:+ start:6134 stop:6835 length:702 start_codon:yes stop_codon:yes gene_type:complete